MCMLDIPVTGAFSLHPSFWLHQLPNGTGYRYLRPTNLLTEWLGSLHKDQLYGSKPLDIMILFNLPR